MGTRNCLRTAGFLVFFCIFRGTTVAESEYKTTGSDLTNETWCATVFYVGTFFTAKLSGFNKVPPPSIWVVVKIMVPFWVP